MSSNFAQFCQRTGLRRSLLVIAPHPDDETIGCGGLIALAAASGVCVVVVVVTDGAASHPGSATWPPERIAHRRKREVLRAIEILGVKASPHFLNLPDTQTATIAGAIRQGACDRLAGVIEEHQPDVVLTTWRREPHCDHRFSYALTRDSMQDASSSAMLVEYMVWTYLIGAADDRPRPHETAGFLLDVGDVRSRKRSALAAHRSQLGRIIRDDPGGFALSRAHMRTMTIGEERFELPH